MRLMTVNIKFLTLIIYEPIVRCYLKEKYKQIIQNVLLTFHLHVTIYIVTDCYILVHWGSFFQAVTVIKRWPVRVQMSCSSTPLLSKRVTGDARNEWLVNTLNKRNKFTIEHMQSFYWKPAVSLIVQDFTRFVQIL